MIYPSHIHLTLKIINGLGLQVADKEIISLLGSSGCGKSTLLNLLAGLLVPQAGKISVTGECVYQTQTVTLLPYQTALENALFACELRGLVTVALKQKALQLFALFNLGEATKKKFPNELSGGMRQRIAIIQTLLVEAGLYLLDEPFNAIDRATVLTISDYMWKKVKDQNASAMMVTHDLEQIILLSDRVVLMPNSTVLTSRK